MNDKITSYDQAWNETDGSVRRRLLEESLTEDCELIEPRGRFVGRAAIEGRLTGFTERFPGARVDVTTNIDEHNGFARYGWIIRDAQGQQLLDGIDVVDLADDGRIRRVVMFFGPLGTPT